MPIRNYIHNFLWIVLKTLFLLFYGISPYLLYSEGKLYSSTSLIFNFCISYRNHPASWRNIRAHPGARRGFFFWSSGQRCRTNRSPELWFGRARIYWPYKYLYRQAPVHNPFISNYATYCFYLLVHLSYWSWLETLDA